MAESVKKEIRERKYLNKTFDGFQRDLLNYARTYYGDRIKDFSDASVGGMFLDLAAYVGDSMSFYLDHQFSELNPLEAVETVNIESHLTNSGVDITGAAAAVVDVSLILTIPANSTDASKPNSALYPIIRKGTILRSDDGIAFNLLEDVDFSQVDKNGTLLATIQLAESGADGVPTAYFVTRTTTCISGVYEEESFTLGDFVPFKKITLGNSNVTQLLSVYDSDGNVYYEVSDLSEDTAFKAVQNHGYDSDSVKDTLIVVPAPYRFTKSVDLATRSTTLTLGGGSATSTEDDIIPDPSSFAVPLYGKRTFPVSTINPNSLLRTRTLGIYAQNTTLYVQYYWGGGLDHNVEAGTINEAQQLVMDFPFSADIQRINAVRSSLTVNNSVKANGGDDAPAIETLRDLIPNARNAQSRIVSKEDLLSRIYTLPANFGRVFRAAIRPNPNNPNAAQLYVISRDINSQLTFCTDTLKNNIKTYLNQYRLIADAIDIMDAKIVNLKLTFEVAIDQSFNNAIVLQNVLKSLKTYFEVVNFHIDQPIVMSEVISLIFKTQGVLAVNNRPSTGMVKFTNPVGEVDGRNYSGYDHDIARHTIKGLILPPPGGIFEIRYPDIDIKGVNI